MSDHIFTASMQPATNFVDRNCEKPMRFRCKPQSRKFTYCCRKKRFARNLTVQVFYDSIRFWCRDGKGCKIL